MIMFRMFSRLVALVALAASATVVVAQAPVNIRLATLAPDNSPWATALKSMGATWMRETSNRVRLTVYAGTIPSEKTAISRMQLSGLEAGALSAGGLADIDEAFNVFGIPFFFESDAELAHVQQKLTPLIAARLDAKKFHLLNWGHGGWVQVFSKKPIRTIAELKGAKLFTSEGSPKMVQWYTQNGFHAVPLATSEIPKQLKLPTGAIDAAPSPPVFAVALQFFRDAPYMLDLRVAPLTSATVVTAAAWNRISPEDRAKMTEAAKATERQMHADAPALDAKSIAEMKAAGLNVVAPDARALAEFKAAADELMKTQRGGMVPADVYDAAVRERDAFRRGRAGSAER
jgi:TRAP-type C4-dicarboxylate transport system substrate-binding protein